MRGGVRSPGNTASHAFFLSPSAHLGIPSRLPFASFSSFTYFLLYWFSLVSFYRFILILSRLSLAFFNSDFLSFRSIVAFCVDCLSFLSIVKFNFFLLIQLTFVLISVPSFPSFYSTSFSSFNLSSLLISFYVPPLPPSPAVNEQHPRYGALDLFSLPFLSQLLYRYTTPVNPICPLFLLIITLSSTTKDLACFGCYFLFIYLFFLSLLYR